MARTALPPLLTLCARSQAGPPPDRLAAAARKVSHWPGLLGQAEAHGLAPLLYRYLEAAGVSPPEEVAGYLRGHYLRHRYANRVRAELLAEILAALESAGIQALVLKGMALAHLIYAQPGLRPMADIDLLVRPEAARPAQEILAGLGFEAPLPRPNSLPGKHLAPALRTTAGIPVAVEVHHHLFSVDSATPLAWPTAPLAFSLADRPAYTLPPAEMLWHLCRHMGLIAQPFRLIWLADVVGMAEQFAATVDWEEVARRYPAVLNCLALFHYLTPLSDALRRVLPVTMGPPPAGVGESFEGWPHTSFSQLRAAGKSLPRILKDTLLPSEWWLRLYYRRGSTGPLFFTRWVEHPLHILSQLGPLISRRAERNDGGR